MELGGSATTPIGSGVCGFVVGTAVVGVGGVVFGTAVVGDRVGRRVGALVFLGALVISGRAVGNSSSIGIDETDDLARTGYSRETAGLVSAAIGAEVAAGLAFFGRLVEGKSSGAFGSCGESSVGAAATGADAFALGFTTGTLTFTGALTGNAAGC